MRHGKLLADRPSSSCTAKPICRSLPARSPERTVSTPISTKCPRRLSSAATEAMGSSGLEDLNETVEAQIRHYPACQHHHEEQHQHVGQIGLVASQPSGKLGGSFAKQLSRWNVNQRIGRKDV